MTPLCRYVDGAKAASSILQQDQRNVGALFLRGFCLYHKNNIERALTHFQQVCWDSRDLSLLLFHLYSLWFNIFQLASNLQLFYEN